MDSNTLIMESVNPSKHTAEVQYVTPECSSRYSMISAVGEDSGYSSVSSSGISTRTFREGSLSPIDVRKRLFDASSSTPELSSRKARTSLGQLFGRCLLPMVTVEEEAEPQDSGIFSEKHGDGHGLLTPTKSSQGKKFFSSTPSPKKRHPRGGEALGKLCSTSTISFKQNTRTPPRKALTRSPIKKFPSFSELSVFRDPNRPRHGTQYVDFLWCLGKERMMAPALSLVLSYLGGEDLRACCIVNKTWQTLVMSDKTSNTRRLEAVAKLKVMKENILYAPLNCIFNSQKENRSALSVIQEDGLMPPAPANLKTPPPKRSPNRFRFELFMKEGHRVDENEAQCLMKCPRCTFPSLVDTKLNLGVCTRQGCQFRFCTLCHCSEHGAPVNSYASSSPPRYIMCPFAAMPTSPPSPPQPGKSAIRRRLDLVGSKRSKRNLRRL